MINIPSQDIAKYSPLFDEYSHNTAVIHSSIEGQYAGELFVNKQDNPDIAILFTPFDFAYVAGNPSFPNAIEVLKDVIFDYINEHSKEEMVVFSPTEQWHSILAAVFDKHNGLSDYRKVFALNQTKFESFKQTMQNRNDVTATILYEQQHNSVIAYPVARVYKDGACVSHCAGFMLGKNHAEIDVGTEEGYEQQGYATIAAALLIDELLQKGITPDWNTWPYKEASQALAKKLGFEEQPSAKAFIWLKHQ